MTFVVSAGSGSGPRKPGCGTEMVLALAGRGQRVLEKK
ncbi:uncharacterized protein PgNI_03204 [Pyricularia grisea]|uniref:Uncharacterized protein n=1 Tax=Pyricularia grisea TaxID=148305 RepID=A0A6P8BBK7_PYRGI|nr:uncharacterized protein PgNI_03204 [Pyricularia grisea]TLD13210.1 hypothetical protein PgNI_03204 [Pyricularia grisea]